MALLARPSLPPLSAPPPGLQAFPNAAHMDAYVSDQHIYWPTLRGFFSQQLGDDLLGRR